MTGSAWLFLGLAWSGITVLLVYCYYRVLTTGTDKTE
jgi:hypothetical protein